MAAPALLGLLKGVGAAKALGADRITPVLAATSGGRGWKLVLNKFVRVGRGPSRPDRRARVSIRLYVSFALARRAHSRSPHTRTRDSARVSSLPSRLRSKEDASSLLARPWRLSAERCREKRARFDALSG